MPVRLMQDPLTAVVRGTGIILDDLETLNEVLITDDQESRIIG
jgi:actin-like ATPase involved in cell morphogenesis